MLITVGYAPGAIPVVHTLYAHIRLAAVDRCRYCVDYERTLPIYVLSNPTRSTFPRLWLSLKHFD